MLSKQLLVLLVQYKPTTYNIKKQNTTMLRCHNTCEMGKAERVSFFFPREAQGSTPGQRQMQGSVSLSPSLCSTAACMQKSSPHSQASGTAFARGQGRIRSSSESGLESSVFTL